MILIYRSAASCGARALAEELDGGVRLKASNLKRLSRKFTNADVLVAWGDHLQGFPGRSLNNVAPLSKLSAARRLTEAKVPTVPTNKSKPGDGWVGRTNDHMGGNDLLNPPRQPDFYVQRLDIVKEFRVHSFLGRSIASRVKVLRDGFKLETEPRHRGDAVASPWIRSWDGGWKMVYKDGEVKKKHRTLAHQAVKALGLDFGAVDIGQLADGKLIVLEVNTAPGIEGETLLAYSKAVSGWSRGELTPKES